MKYKHKHIWNKYKVAKRIISLILVACLCFSVTVTANAQESNVTTEPPVYLIDENG